MLPKIAALFIELVVPLSMIVGKVLDRKARCKACPTNVVVNLVRTLYRDSVEWKLLD